MDLHKQHRNTDVLRTRYDIDYDCVKIERVRSLSSGTALVYVDVVDEENVHDIIYQSLHSKMEIDDKEAQLDG